ncbi:MAG: DUF222 domain-containing protein, partial [Candidatus Dormibacteraeota bacterium]|nr:DUF222 domain-containing protein [Candidatus Dormibacteraeota bacterium]
MYETGARLDPLADLEAAVARYRARPRGARSCEQSGAEQKRLRRLIDQLELESGSVSREFSAGWAAELAADDEFALDGYESPMAWIRHEAKVPGRVVSDGLAVAEHRGILPASIAAMEAGRIGFGHLVLLARTAAAVAESPSSGPFDEGHLLKQAEKHPVNRFRRDCSHVRHAVDAAAFLTDHNNDVEERFLEVSTRDDGCVWLRGFLDSVGGASVRTVLESLARRTGKDDERLRDRRLADALVETAEFALQSEGIGVSGARAPQLMLTASVETLRGMPGAPAAELEFAEPIAAEAARRISCDANVIAVTTDGEGRAIAVGRSRRMPNTATRRKLALRDCGCVVPGCDRPASWTVPHHVVHHADGGTSELTNLVLLWGLLPNSLLCESMGLATPNPTDVSVEGRQMMGSKEV